MARKVTLPDFSSTRAKITLREQLIVAQAGREAADFNTRCPDRLLMKAPIHNGRGLGKYMGNNMALDTYSKAQQEWCRIFSDIKLVDILPEMVCGRLRRFKGLLAGV